MRFRVPAGSYATVTASTLDTSSVNASQYQGFANVTSQVAAAGSGTYTVANIQAGTGQDRWGGWSLAVAYSVAGNPVKWVGIYDGFDSMGSGGVDGNISITLDGFTAPSPGPVAADLGIAGYEGEITYTTETMNLNALPVSDAVHPANNPFNASITRLGSHVTTKNPNYINQLGYDSAVFDIDGLITPGLDQRDPEHDQLVGALPPRHGHAGDRPGRDRARQHRAAVDQRHGADRPDPHRQRRDVDRHGADHLHPPVAALQRRGGELLEHRRRHRDDLRRRSAATRARRSAWS